MFYIIIFEFVFIHSELYIYSYQLLVLINFVMYRIFIYPWVFLF